MATQPTDPKPRGGPAPAMSGMPAPGASVPGADAPGFPDYAARALLLWPGLDRGRLATTKGDPRRIARLVTRRTNLPPEAILRMLGVRPAVDRSFDDVGEDA
jgi:hypothetical protein